MKWTQSALQRSIKNCAVTYLSFPHGDATYLTDVDEPKGAYIVTGHSMLGVVLDTFPLC